MATYEEVDHGSSIVQLLRDEWALFRESGLHHASAKELLADVLDDGEVVRRGFAPITHQGPESLSRWEYLCQEMMHRNRWFLSDPMDMERIGELLHQLITPLDSLEGLKWYRARLMRDDTSYPLEEMGAPPKHRAGHGRANPAGIPYLYLASTRETSVAELRPHTGEKACVAEFEFDTIASNLKFADLRAPRSLVSPLSGDETEIVRLRQDLPLLERLGEELTRPVQAQGAAYEYIPTQYLCEYIKTCGFDGVVYRSSVSSDGGINIALFDPDAARPISAHKVSVERVSVGISD